MAKKNDVVIGLFLFSFGCLICLYYGRIGFMPLDQSVVFDGGWRICSGQTLYHDFAPSTGVFTVLMQGVIFKIFGVNWFIYCLHAAVINGVFCVVVACLLRMLGLGRWMAAGYALLSGILLYPPSGTPYMEQHSFFFMILAVTAAVGVQKTTRVASAQAGLAFLLIPLCLMAYTSKQNPGAMAFPLVIMIIAPVLIRGGGQPVRNRVLRWTAAGAATCALTIAVAIWYWDLDLRVIHQYTFDQPAALGTRRILRFQDELPARVLLLFELLSRSAAFNTIVVGALIWTIAQICLHFTKTAAVISRYRATAAILLAAGALLLSTMIFGRLNNVLLIVGVTGLALASAVGRAIASGSDSDAHRDRTTPFNLFLAFTVFGVCFAFTNLANNHPANGIPYLFISFGIIHHEFLNACRRFLAPRSRLVLALGMFLFGAAAADSWMLNHTINRTRLVHDMVVPEHIISGDATLDPLPQDLTFMRFAVGRFYRYTAADLTNLVQYLRARDENFYLFGDTSILYGLTRRPSVSPSLMFDIIHSIPPRNTPEFVTYQERVIENLRRFDVRLIIKEGDETFMGLRFADFPCLESLDLRFLVRFGAFQVYELENIPEDIAWK